MSKLAETLHVTRRSRGEQLEEVEQITRIRKAYLQALEADDFRRLPPPVYTRGFVRNYAAHLGLDPEQMVRFYDEAIGYALEPASLHRSDGVRVSRLVAPNVAAIGVGVALAGIIFVWLYSAVFVDGPARVARLPTPVVPTPTALTAMVPPSPAPTPEPTPAALAASPTARPAINPAPPAPTQVAVAKPSPPPAPTPTQGLALAIKVIDAPSWVQVRTDGVVVFTGTLAPGAERLFSANREIFIHGGRSDAIELVLNGRPQGRLGQAGQTVVRRTFTTNDIARLAPPP